MQYYFLFLQFVMSINMLRFDQSSGRTTRDAYIHDLTCFAMTIKINKSQARNVLTQ